LIGKAIHFMGMARMAVTLIQDWLTGAQLHTALGQMTPHLTLLAQTYSDDLGSNLQGAWNNFIQSGQVWALLIGLVVGYIFRSITSY
jgi:hypothetical protein